MQFCLPTHDIWHEWFIGFIAFPNLKKVHLQSHFVTSRWLLAIVEYCRKAQIALNQVLQLFIIFYTALLSTDTLQFAVTKPCLWYNPKSRDTMSDELLRTFFYFNWSPVLKLFLTPKVHSIKICIEFWAVISLLCF